MILKYYCEKITRIQRQILKEYQANEIGEEKGGLKQKMFIISSYFSTDQELHSEAS